MANFSDMPKGLLYGGTSTGNKKIVMSTTTSKDGRTVTLWVKPNGVDVRAEHFVTVTSSDKFQEQQEYQYKSCKSAGRAYDKIRLYIESGIV